MSRQFKHIELTPTDALLLREAIRPLKDYDHIVQPSDSIGLCKKLYAALIELEDPEIPSFNIPLNETECLIINHCVGVEDWDGAKGILRATWAILYELENDMPPMAGSALLDSLRVAENAEGSEQRQ